MEDFKGNSLEKSSISRSLDKSLPGRPGQLSRGIPWPELVEFELLGQEDPVYFFSRPSLYDRQGKFWAKCGQAEG